MATLLEFECPACGGGLQFDAASQNVKCPYCDTEFTMESLQQIRQEQATVNADDMQWQDPTGSQWQDGEAVDAYICQSCGGQLLCDANTAATRCPYCDSPVVLTQRVEGQLRPDLVIPFQLDKEAAKAALTRHMSGKILLPKCFKSENRLDKIQGVYVPFWLFDAEADAEIRYHATRVRTWSDSRYHYTKTSHYSIHRAGDLGFSSVPADGSAKMPNDLMESIEPYDLSKAVDFQTAYLAGYLADKYDVTAEESKPRVNERIKASTEQAFAGTVMGYTTVVPQQSSVQLKNTAVKYALFPVWLLNTKWNGKTYTFAMNGQTGKMVGDLPMDKRAFWLWWAGISAAATVLFGLIAWLFY